MKIDQLLPVVKKQIQTWLLSVVVIMLTVNSNAQNPVLTKATSSHAQLKLNKRFYNSGDVLSASMKFGVIAPMYDQYVVFVSPKTGDAEVLKLRAITTTEFTTEGTLKILIGLNKASKDGVLSTEAGEVIVAYYYNKDLSKDPKQVKQTKTNQPDIISEFAFVREKENTNTGFLINKKYALSQNEAADNAATLLVEGQMPVQIARNQLIFYSNNAQQWKDFVEYSKCKLIATIAGNDVKNTGNNKPGITNNNVVTAGPTIAGNAGATYLVEVPVADQNLNDLGQLRQFLGYKQKLICSDEETMKMIQFCAMANLDGFAVSLNPRLQFNSEETATTLKYFSNPGDTENLPVSFSQPLTDIRKVWNYMAIWDRDNVPVNVAILDMGFHTNPDFRNASTMRECVADALSVRCSPGAAQGLPTVGNSLFGGRSWHGNGVVSRISGVLNNNFGTAGTGGQVAVPMLIKMAGIETYAFNIGGAIRSAVNNGANVINISAGFPCRALTSIGDFTYCDPGVRGAICAALFPIVQSGAVLACSALGFIPFATEICLSVASSTYISACVAAIAIGNPGDVIASAVQFAKSRGVPVVASAGNIISPASLGAIPAELRNFVNLDINRMTVEDWDIVPAGLDDVICVGASHPSASVADVGTPNFPPFIPFGNNQVFGARVDVWAPEDGRYFAPASTSSLPSPGTPDVLQGEFGGTSASAPFITGLIADAMALNPQFNRNTSSNVGNIAPELRRLLTSTAWPSGRSGLPADSRRRNLVNPIGFLKAVAFAPGSPIPNFSTSVYGDNWNVETTENSDDVTPTVIAYSSSGATRTGSIISIPGSGGAAAITDIDRYRINVLSTYRPVAGEMISVKLRTPTGSRFGNLTINGTGLSLVRTNVLGANEEEKIYQGPAVSAGMTLDFVVQGATPNQDNIYLLSIGNAVAPRSESVVTATLTDITTELCPTTLERGDREFGGGPLINITARLERTADESGIDVIINYRAEETGGDRTTATGEFRQRVFNAAAGTRIVAISPSMSSSSVVNFRGAGAGAEFGICNEGVVQQAPVTGGLIRRIVVVGDTGGNDVSAGGGCRCDTKIKSINFNPISITTLPR